MDIGDGFSDDDGDLECISDKRGSSFLLNDLEDGKPSKKLKTTEDEYAERKYKQEKMNPTQEVHHMLPIKTQDGIQQRARVIGKVKSGKEPQPETEKEEAEEAAAPSSMAELYALRHKYIVTAKQDIAKCCCAITEDPYNNTAAMKKLRHYCSTEDRKAGQTIQKLAIVSLTAVYNDILPSYTVKPSQELDSLSKEVKVQHSYETELLRNYRVFLDRLSENVSAAFATKKSQRSAATKTQTAQRRQLGLVSLRSMCELLSNNYNFNLRSQLVTAVVPYAASKALGGKLSDIVMPAIIEILGKDKQGECSVEIVRVIAALIKKRGSNINVRLLECLHHVRLVELREVEREKQEVLPDTATLSKKQRKHRKEQAKVRKELLEADAVESKQKLSRQQSESLDHMFVTYFRILKQLHDTPLLPLALKGLSKFAHLINVNFFTDLFECLKRIIKEEELQLSDSLNCVSTIFTILSGQGSVLDVDIGEFYTLLYDSLLHLTQDTQPSIFRLVSQTLSKAARRPVSLSCQMAVVKRLCTVATSLTPLQSHILLCEARKMVRNSPKISNMLQCDEEFGTPYSPDSMEPGQAHAEGAVLWELALLAKQCYHQSLRNTAHHVASYDPNSAKRAEINHFVNDKFKELSDFVILDDSFPKTCKKMQNRRIKLSDKFLVNDENSNSIQKLEFFSDINKSTR